MLTSGTLRLDKTLDMEVVSIMRALVVTAGRAGENLLAVGDAPLLRVCEHRQRLLNIGVRHRIVVQIKPDVGRLANLDGHLFEQRIAMLRQCQQSWCLLGEDLADAAEHQASAWALRSSTSAKRRAAKKALRT